jgi:enoyl-CoA hydratase/carnithine racemase
MTGFVADRPEAAPSPPRTHFSTTLTGLIMTSLNASPISSDADIIVEKLAQHIVRVRLARPHRLNAFDMSMAKNLKDAVSEVVASSARVLLISGTGRGFCVGADLKERRTMTVEQRRQHNFAINEAFDTIAKAPIVTVAVVNGVAMGGGCELALTCDLRIAAEDALIGLTETRIGVIPGAGGTQRLPRLIGAARALELMLTGEPITGKRAAEIGLVNQAVPLDKLDECTLDLAILLASRSPVGLREIKQLVYESFELPLDEGLQIERQALVRVLDSADYREGLTAFAERRKPNFTGR